MHRKSPVTHLAVAFLSCLILACGGSGGVGPTAPDSVAPSQVEIQSANLINNERATREVDPQLSLERRLANVARAHSEAMRAEGRLFHDGVDGDLESRLTEAGIFCSVAAENVARVGGAGDPAMQAHTIFMQSPDHRSNILSAQVSVLGVGTVQSGDTYWITQIFIEP